MHFIGIGRHDVSIYRFAPLDVRYAAPAQRRAFARRNAAREISSFVLGDGYATDGDDGGSIMIFVYQPQADAAGPQHKRR